MAKILEKAGVSGIHVDVGCYEAWYKAISTVYQEEGHQVPVFSEVKKGRKRSCNRTGKAL